VRDRADPGFGRERRRSIRICRQRSGCVPSVPASIGSRTPPISGAVRGPSSTTARRAGSPNIAAPVHGEPACLGGGSRRPIRRPAPPAPARHGLSVL